MLKVYLRVPELYLVNIIYILLIRFDEVPLIAIFCVLKKVFFMQISSKEFFSCLSVDSRYYSKLFLSFGVKSTFFFDRDDLLLIITNLRIDRYKSLLVKNRASEVLAVQHV